MRVVLLSGGTGRRLWPISGEQAAKQFLRLMPHGESMLERMLRQLKSAGLAEQITIVTGNEQHEILREQLGKLPATVLVEPIRRNTFPAVALACAHLSWRQNVPPNETVLVLPIDSYVNDDYFQLLAGIEAAMERDAADIFLVGATPTYPSQKYGYILPQKHGAIAEVCAFYEKPNESAATEYIKQGALWNCGVVAFRLGFFTARYLQPNEADPPGAAYEALEDAYSSLEENSFDRVVLEKNANMRVVRYDGAWMDVGTWNTLADVLDKPAHGNVRMDASSQNTHVINTRETPVVVMGARDMIVVVSEKGVLVADKTRSSFVLEMLDDSAQ
ncbi:MAG: NTP transferase domain-containing protein [Oscillospiraceae bacterium]|jgi:mannose-1-phosphate guanylyltransferase|nr:NTP transferase domain-containing protein [Oscillospiraceae bacterium]